MNIHDREEKEKEREGDARRKTNKKITRSRQRITFVIRWSTSKIKNIILIKKKVTKMVNLIWWLGWNGDLFFLVIEINLFSVNKINEIKIIKMKYMRINLIILNLIYFLD